MTSESIEKSVHEAIEKANFIAVRDRLEVGEGVGLYTVTHSDAGHVRMAVGSGGALLMFIAGVVILLLDIWLFKTGTIRWMRVAPVWFKGAIVGLPFIGLFMVFMLGRSFEFQGSAATGTGMPLIQKRWLWFFGQPIEASRLAAVLVRVRPRSARSYDHIVVCLVDSGGMDVMEVADEASDEKGVGAALTLAIQLGKVLGKPVRIEGEPVVMNDYAKDAMRRMGEKIARG